MSSSESKGDKILSQVLLNKGGYDVVRNLTSIGR